MTPAEKQIEIAYRKAEREMISTDGRRDPTPAESRAALDDAEQWRSNFEQQEAFARIEAKRESGVLNRSLERRFPK